jgi:hypothetical protein
MPETNPTKTEAPAETPRPWQPIDDWTTLKGQTIEIHRGGSVIDRGRVDDVLADGSALWLTFDGASRRRIIEHQSGTYVRRIHDDQTPSAY